MIGEDKINRKCKKKTKKHTASNSSHSAFLLIELLQLPASLSRLEALLDVTSDVLNNCSFGEQNLSWNVYYLYLFKLIQIL